MANAHKLMKDFVSHWCKNNIETIAPAIITKVEDYGAMRVVDVQPLVIEEEPDQENIQHPVVYKVPVILQATKLGYMSYPLEIGDTVAVGYCKRSSEEFTFGDHTNPYLPVDKRLFGSTDAVVLGYWGQGSKDLPVSATDFELVYRGFKLSVTPNDEVLLTNPTASINIKEDGQVLVEGPVGSIDIQADGTIVITSGSSTITVKTDGTIDANGCTIDGSGNVITASGTDLDQLKADFDQFTSVNFNTHLHANPSSPPDKPWT